MIMNNLMQRSWKVFKIYLIDFLSIILVASIIKHNDRHYIWFSEDPILGHYFIKLIMIVSKLLKIMRYLHVCDI